MQLDLPFQPDVVEAWTMESGDEGGDRSLKLAVNLTQIGVEASMVVAGPGGGNVRDGVSAPPSNWRVRLSVRHPVDAVIRLDDQQESMNEADIPVAYPGQGLQWDRMPFFAKPFFLVRRTLGRSVLSRETGRVARSFQLMADHLDRLWVEGGAAAAAPFPLKGGMRWFVYSLVVADQSGRVAQMARTCPGILILCKALRDHRGADECIGLLKSIIAGRRLGRVLDEAVDAWSRVRSGGPPSKAMGHAPDGSVHDEDRVAQRLRIQRAGGLVPSWFLWRRVPGRVVPEDIPGELDGNMCWFRATSGLWLDRARERLSPVQLHGLIGFLSRNWRWAGEGKNADAQDRAVFMDHLVDYLANTGRILDRSCSQRRLMERIDRWEYNLMRHPRCYDPDVRLETHGLGLWQGEQGKMEVISTVGELVEESRRMGHCVSAYAEEGVTGRAIFFHGDLNGEAVTVQLEPREDGQRYHLVEAAGRQNRHVSPEGKAIMWRWLAELNEPENSGQ